MTQLKSLPKFSGHENEIKLQQLLMLLISKNNIQLGKMNFAHSIINLVFSLENSKNRTIWLKTHSALAQIIGLCINDLQDNE